MENKIDIQIARAKEAITDYRRELEVANEVQRIAVRNYQNAVEHLSGLEKIKQEK